MYLQRFVAVEFFKCHFPTPWAQLKFCSLLFSAVFSIRLELKLQRRTNMGGNDCYDISSAVTLLS